MPGALIISQDVELLWGVRDYVGTGHPYLENLRGERAATTAMLSCFEDRGIACTWATVGFLFAAGQADLERHRPALTPTYDDPRLDPYVDAIGADRHVDPLHFGRDIVEEILTVPGQEMGSHTYSHFYCGAPGQTKEQFHDDLRAAREIAAGLGVTIRSLVFPRNQVNPEYLGCLREEGITSYRGTQPMWAYSADVPESQPKRAARLINTYAPVGGDHLVDWDEVVDETGLANLRASFFVRPWSKALAAFESARIMRLRRAMTRAARERKILHLWWHPHNFGRDLERNMHALEHVLDEYEVCRRRFGMESLTMAEAGERVL